MLAILSVGLLACQSKHSSLPHHPPPFTRGRSSIATPRERRNWLECKKLMLNLIRKKDDEKVSKSTPKRPILCGVHVLVFRNTPSKYRGVHRGVFELWAQPALILCCCLALQAKVLLVTFCCFGILTIDKPTDRYFWVVLASGVLHTYDVLTWHYRYRHTDTLWCPSKY